MTITVEGPGGATVEFPDGTPTETIDKAMTDYFGGGKKEASGFVAGMAHGAQDLVQGAAETGKQFAGVGPGRQVADPNYVPADVRNGTWNPLKWNYGQVPQAIAEQAPGLMTDIAAGAGTAKTAKSVGAGTKAAALAGLVGAGVSGWTRSAGDTAKEAAVARTGDADAETNTTDKVKGGLTAAAANAVGALLPTRFIGGSKLANVGVEGVTDAAKRLTATAGVGAGAGAGADLITQAGTKLGTDASIDLGRTGDAAVNGMFTGTAFGTPKALGEATHAVSKREHGGENRAATENYATRLNEHGEGVGGLGKASRDAEAQRLVKDDLKNEIGDAARKVREQVSLSADADNALQRVQNDHTITPKDLSLIERETAGAPDGANAAYLARTLRMAQLAQSHGSYSASGWAGGLSGVMDKNLAFMLNPTRAVGGALATAAGMHVMGLGNPKIALGVGAGYLGARAVDGLAGMRSPAKSYAQHFASQSAQLRMPTTAPAQPPTAPQPTNAPWGPRPPMSGPTGPQVGPQAPQQAPQGPWGPKPLATTSVPQMGAPGLPTAPPAPTTPWQTPQINELWKGPNPLALKMMAEQMKKGLPAEPTPEAPKLPWATPRVREEWNKPTVSDPAMPPLDSLVKPTPTEVPNDVLGKSKKLMAALASVQKMKDKALAPTGEPASLGAAAAPAGPQSIGDILRNMEARSAKPKTIKKADGKLKTEEAPKAAKAEFEPFAEEHLYPPDISAKEYAAREMGEYKASSPKYLAKAERTAQKRIDAEASLLESFPGYKHAIKGLLRQLHRIGRNPEEVSQAVDLYASHVPDDVGNAMREAFK